MPILKNSWQGLNLAMAGLACLSGIVMLLKRRWAETALLGLPFLALGLTTLAPHEASWLPMIGLLAPLVFGGLTAKPVVIVDEDALAERASRKAAKRASREEKRRDKKERQAQKRRDRLYAFDKPSRRQRKRAANKAAPEIKPGILSERTTDADDKPASNRRPI